MNSDEALVLNRWRDIDIRLNELQGADHLCKDEQRELHRLCVERKFLFVHNRDLVIANNPHLSYFNRVVVKREFDFDWSKEGF